MALTDIACGPLELFLAAGEDHDVQTSSGGRVGEGGADTHGAAGDEGPRPVPLGEGRDGERSAVREAGAGVGSPAAVTIARRRRPAAGAGWAAEGVA